VSELLDRVNAEIRERLQALRPLVREHDRLEAALVALGGIAPSRGETTAAAASPPTDSAVAARRGRAASGSTGRTPLSGRRRRAPRGANRTAVLAAARERPGATAGELAAAAGVSRPVVYALVKALTENGELVRTDLPDDSGGYAVPPEPPAAGWSGSVPAQDANAPGDARRGQHEPATT
jgi:DNA-binding transcriptional ArsR family regulator